MVDAWREAFADFENVEAIQGDYFSIHADAMVSPANSFGFMDGGLDKAIRDKLGVSIQEKVQKVILEKYHGELPVGMAEIVETNHAHWRFLVGAPTMRVPENISQTLNAYLSFRAILLAVKRFNESATNQIIQSLLCPGLGTATGRMPPRKCAAQMRVAYNHLYERARIPDFQEIRRVHAKMHRAS